MLRLPLPSEFARGRRDDDVVIGQPAASHIARSGEALTEVADAFTRASSAPSSASPRVLDVVISHADHQGFLTADLRFFHLPPVAEGGAVLDSFEPGRPVRFVFLVNQPVSVQVESAITSMSSLAARQAKIAQVQAGAEDVTEIDRWMAKSDDVARNEVVDVLRHGWQAATEYVVRQAVSAGFTFRVNYQSATAPKREEVVRRMPALRRAYNSMPTVRDAVDRFVSSIAPRGRIVAPPEVPEAVRAFAQQESSLGAWGRYTAELLRDALVVGNGYLAFDTSAPFKIYNLRPDDAVDVGDEMASPSSDEAPVHALHLRALQQPGSAYGLGIVELALPYLQQLDVFNETAAFANQVLATPARADRHDWARRTLGLAERAADNADAKLRQVFAPMLSLLPEPVANLYF